MARLEVGIGATNKELKSVLSDSETIVRRFSDNLKKINLNIGVNDRINKRIGDTSQSLRALSSAARDVRGIKIDLSLGNAINDLKNLNAQLTQTKKLYTDIRGVISSINSSGRTTVGGAGSKQALEAEKLALVQARTEAQRYKNEIGRVNAELARMRLASAQARQSTNAAAGSYREAQQKLTALGRSIREQAGGFDLNNKAVQAQIAQYRQLNAQLKAFDAAMGNHQRNVGNYGSVWAGIGSQLASVAAGYLSVQTAINGVTAAFNSAMKSDAIQASMTFILRNADDVSARLGRVQMSAERLGLGYLGLATTYRSFIGAANASNFSLFEAERIFDAVSNAAGKLKLSNDQVQGAFRALEQMISKGNVQAEELRGQLGERIPGAFAIAARAMGVTEKQLNKMLKDGDVLAKDLLPRLATELNKTFGFDQSEKVDSLQGSVNRLKNTFDVAIQEGNVSKFFQTFVDGTNFALKSINELVNSNGWKEFLENFVMFTNPQFFGGAWSRQVNNSIKTPDDLINSQVSEFTNKPSEERAKIWQREKKIYDSMLADYKAGNKSIQQDLIYQGKLVAAIGQQYFESLKSQSQVAEGAKELTKEQLAALEKIRKENEQYQKHLQKLRETAHLDTLQGYERELQAARYKWEEELKDARHGIKELLELRRMYVAETMRIMGKMNFTQGFNQSATGQAVRNRYNSDLLNMGPATLPVPQLGKTQIAVTQNSEWVKEIGEGLKRASRRFVSDFTNAINQIGDGLEVKFDTIFGHLGMSLLNSFGNIFENQLANKFESIIGAKLAEIEKKVQAGQSLGLDGWLSKYAIYAGLGGQLLQGITKRTSIAGQTVGGALSGAATGAMAGGVWGAVAGLVIGGLSGLFSASSARRQEKITEQQLEEQKKQTALMERQNALAYTSQIIGQQTNQGLVTGVDRDEFGNIRFRIEGQDLVASLARTTNGMGRGV